MRKRQYFLHRTEYFHEALLMKENYCRSDNFFLLLQRWVMDFSLLFFLLIRLRIMKPRQTPILRPLLRRLAPREGAGDSLPFF